MAIFRGSTPLFVESCQGEPARAPEWMAVLARQLHDLNLRVADFDAFICGLGPGSFSGIRAALAALQGAALPLERPVLGVASAAALALEIALECGCSLVTVVGDARRERLWCANYRVENSIVKLANGAQPEHTADDFQLLPAKELKAAVPPTAVVVSSDWPRLERLLCQEFDAHQLVPGSRFPSARHLAHLALTDTTTCTLEPLPIYLHPAVTARAATTAVDQQTAPQEQRP